MSEKPFSNETKKELASQAYTSLDGLTVMAITVDMMDQRLKDNKGREGDSLEKVVEMQKKFDDQMANAALALSKVFGVEHPYLSDEKILEEHRFTLQNETESSSNRLESSVTLDPYGSRPVTLELIDQKKDGTIEFTMALMKQGPNTGVKMFFRGTIDKEGNLGVGGDGGIPIIETYQNGRETMKIGFDEDDKVLRLSKIEYDQPSQESGAIPQREINRTYRWGYDRTSDDAPGGHETDLLSAQGYEYHYKQTTLNTPGILKWFQSSQPADQEVIGDNPVDFLRQFVVEEE